MDVFPTSTFVDHRHNYVFFYYPRTHQTLKKYKPFIFLSPAIRCSTTSFPVYQSWQKCKPGRPVQNAAGKFPC